MAVIVGASAFAQDAAKPATAVKAVSPNGQATMKPVPVAKPVRAVAPQQAATQPVAAPSTRIAPAQSVKPTKPMQVSAPATK